VESEEGEGTTFRFTIPYISASGPFEKKEKAPAANGQKHPNKTINILIAEDDDICLQYLQTILESIDTNVIYAKTGRETVELCRKNPDLEIILMDIKMPEMDGYEATRLIRQFNKQVIIIAQTAYALKGDKLKALEAGCNHYITKPIHKDVLIEKILKQGG
jgi:CheY-like chemotaxis protein